MATHDPLPITYHIRPNSVSRQSTAPQPGTIEDSPQSSPKAKMRRNEDYRQYAPATVRNREPILEVLKTVLPPQGTVLETASGTGEHSLFFASHLPHLKWLPSDPNGESRYSISAWQKFQPTRNLYHPIYLDVSENPWSIETGLLPDNMTPQDLENHPISAILNINMIHISPWEACLGLIAGAKRLLPPDGILYLYGPYKEQDKHTSPSNLSFDQSLKGRNPSWGIRDLEKVIEVAEHEGFTFVKKVQMPANNLSVVFRTDAPRTAQT